MAKQRKNVHRVQMTEGKRNIIHQLLEEYDIQSAENIQASNEKKTLAALDRVTEKWSRKYPNSMKRWKDNWDAISPIFKFSPTARKAIYTSKSLIRRSTDCLIFIRNIGGG